MGCNGGEIGRQRTIVVSDSLKKVQWIWCFTLWKTYLVCNLYIIFYLYNSINFQLKRHSIDIQREETWPQWTRICKSLTVLDQKDKEIENKIDNYISQISSFDLYSWLAGCTRRKIYFIHSVSLSYNSFIIFIYSMILKQHSLWKYLVVERWLISWNESEL